MTVNSRLEGGEKEKRRKHRSEKRLMEKVEGKMDGVLNRADAE